MNRYKRSVQQWLRNLTIAAAFILLGSSLILAYDPALFELAANESPTRSLSQEAARKSLLARRVRIRSRSLARRSFEEAFGRRVEALLREAEAALKAKDYAKARAGAREILILNPHDPKALGILDRAAHPERESKAVDPAFAIFKDEVPFLTARERKRMVDFFMRRADKFLKEGNDDQAVEELEYVFVLDSVNAQASRKIDLIKKRFIRDQKRQWKKQAFETRAEFSEKLAYSLETVKQLIKEGDLMEAKVILNRMAFVNPEDPAVRKLMEEIRKRERQAAEGKDAA